MKFAKCPKCGEFQGLKKVFFLTNFGTRTCKYCKAEYETVKSKVIPATFGIILPLMVGNYLSLFSAYPLLNFLWVFVGLGILMKYLPLRVVNN